MEREQPKAPASPRVPTREKLLQASPWLPAPWALADATALQALQRGQAGPDQQIRALTWIINRACATYDFPYRPGGQDGERDTAMALGRMFAGQQIVKLLNADIAQLRRDEPNADPHEPQS